MSKTKIQYFHHKVWTVRALAKHLRKTKREIREMRAAGMLSNFNLAGAQTVPQKIPVTPDCEGTSNETTD